MEGAADLVDHEGRERLAFDVLGDDQKGFAALGNLLEQRQKVLKIADFLLVDQDIAAFQDGLHGLIVGDEIRREIALIELHALDDLECRINAVGLFHGNGPVVAYLIHCVRDDATDFLVAVRRDGRDVLDYAAVVTHLCAELGEFFNNGVYRGVDAAL